MFLHKSSHSLEPSKSIQSKYHHYPHFIDEKTETQRLTNLPKKEQDLDQVRVHAYDPSYAGGIGKGIEVQDWPLAKT
jgi:hypothetical protein